MGLSPPLHSREMSLSSQRLRELPYPAQISAIDAELEAGRVAELLAELCSYRDHQPLAYALASLARNGVLEEIDPTLITALLDIPDIGLRRVLQGLDEVETPRSFTMALADGAWQLGLERIAAVAMIDRWLKNTAPRDRAERAAAGLAFCEEQLSKGAVEQLPASHLMRLPGTAFSSLADRARKAGCLEPWLACQRQFAQQMLEMLEAQPKSLSQANAEELLARQVYTDPGHFLVELLQNADDAGAELWQVEVFDDRIEVEHNGPPFDALDVVGILSIGQTTKSKEQIGFFGVGFKSVYEICERPQLYSGVFNLEIADVSIPRPLRPIDTLPDGHTRLVLPLRRGPDASISPKQLFQTLAELPAEVVLTLNSVRELNLRYGPQIRHVRGRNEPSGRFRIEDGEASKRYVVERTDAQYDVSRGAHRASHTPVLVAIPLDQEGLPSPSIGAATIFSYLPTRERSGLRVLVHAHFDLPVDRERIDLSSEWNQWALGKAGVLLAKAIARLCHEKAQGDKAADKVLDALPGIVSLPSELNHPAFEAVGSQLHGLAFLPGANGERHPATNALLCEDARLRDAFSTVPLQGGRHVLRAIGERAAEVARWLGAVDLEISAVVDEIVRHAKHLPEGALFAPPWDSQLANVAVALADSSVPLDVLRAVACLPDSGGRARAPGELRRATEELRVFLRHLQPLVRTDLEAPKCSSFLDTLGVATSTVRDLVSLCAEPKPAQQLIDKVGVQALLGFLQTASPAELELIDFAAIVPNDRHSLSAIGDVWITGSTPLAGLVRRMPVRPPLVAQDTEKLLAPSLRALGCRTLDTTALLDCLENESLRIEGESLSALHTALDSTSNDITPNVAKRLAQTCIFPVRDASPRPLVGEAVARIPHDEELAQLWPDQPWLEADVAALPYIRTLGAPVIGPEDLATSLLSQPVGQQLRAIFSYLARHALALSTQTIEDLVQAAIWPDIQGKLRPLDELRSPAEHPSVAALYECWPRAMTMDQDNSPGSALHLASALRVAHRIVAPDFATAIEDLQTASAVDRGAYRSDKELELGNPHVDQVVATLLNDAAQALPRTVLTGICEAPIFLCRDGERRRLGAANAGQRGRALRVPKLLVAVFESFRFNVLEPESAQKLEPLLDALLLRPATLVDLVREAHVGEHELQEESAAQFRQALCRDIASLDKTLRAEISEIAMWPCNGALVPANQVVRGRSLDALLENVDLSRAALGLHEAALLEPVAENEAEMLCTHVQFASPVQLLAETVQRIALVGAPLSSQHDALADTHRVARLAAALARHHSEPWTLPISVNAVGELVAQPLLLATEDELCACAGLPLTEELADADWSRIVGEHDTHLQSLGTRRLLDAMRDVSGDSQQADSHQALHSIEARAAFYRWLRLHAEEISRDDQSLGLLGKSAVILSEEGVLRTPRDLLFDSSLPELGIDWNPSREITEPLQDWLRSNYRPASKQLRPIVDHMLEAIDAAADNGNADRLANVLQHLAKILRAGHDSDELETLAKRFKLRKRLRVETEDGQFAYARRLLAAEPLDADLVPRFALAPPLSAAHRYRQPQTLRLLRAAGAADELSVAALRNYLQGNERCNGNDSDLALACYVGSAAHRQPSLRSDLDLRRRSWLPDALGELRAPNTLYWQTPELEALIGHNPRLYLHPEFVLRAPESRKWLPLRNAKDAAISDIATHLRTSAAKGQPAGANALAWLDMQIAENHIAAKEVRAALADVRMLVDDHGQMRRASELVVSGGKRLFGERRGNWSEGMQLPRLAEALGISRRPQAKDIVAFFAQVHREFVAYPEVLQSDTALLETLPRCLDTLIELGGRSPRQLPATAIKHGVPVLVVLPSPGQRISLPEHEAEAEFVLLVPALLMLLLEDTALFILTGCLTHHDSVPNRLTRLRVLQLSLVRSRLPLVRV